MSPTPCGLSNRPYVALLLYLWVVWRGLRRLHPALLEGFVRSKDSKGMGARRGAEQRSATTRLCVEARRCQRRDHRANASSRQRTRLLWPSITQATTDQPGGAAGKLSAPAQAQCSVSPTRHRANADTRIRLLRRVEFGYHDLEPPSSSHSSPSAATHQNSQAETDPHIQQESAICADMGGVYLRQKSAGRKLRRRERSARLGGNTCRRDRVSCIPQGAHRDVWVTDGSSSRLSVEWRRG